MRTVFLPSLLNRLCEDPGLWVDLQDEGRSILLDLGDVRHVSTRKLLRVERAVVTHTHMDHFVGFDHLLRLMLGRERELVVTGPPGFLERVAGKIAAYTWNLIHDYPIRLRAEEVDGAWIRSVVYSGESGMRPVPQPERRTEGTLHAERLYTLHATLLDHGVPVLGVALHETEHLSVNRDRMEKMGLAPGPWLRDLKEAVRRCEPGDAPVDAMEMEGGRRRFRREALAEALILRRAGQRGSLRLRGGVPRRRRRHGDGAVPSHGPSGRLARPRGRREAPGPVPRLPALQGAGAGDRGGGGRGVRGAGIDPPRRGLARPWECMKSERLLETVAEGRRPGRVPGSRGHDAR